jgi:hypothetical protein
MVYGTEAFVVCEGFRSGMTSEIVQVELGRSKEEVEREMKVILPFISSGDLSYVLNTSLGLSTMTRQNWMGTDKRDDDDEIADSTAKLNIQR